MTAASASRGALAACARCTAACAGSTRRTRHTCFPLASTLTLFLPSAMQLLGSVCLTSSPYVVSVDKNLRQGCCAVSGAAARGGSPEAEAAAAKPAAGLALVFGREESGLQVCLVNYSRGYMYGVKRCCTWNSVLVLCTCKALPVLCMEGARLHVPQAAVHAMHVGHSRGLH